VTEKAPIPVSRDAAEEKPVDPGGLSALVLRHGSLELSWYAPKGTDPQTPHDRDELYVVIAGHGWFVRGEERGEFRPGDALFAAAGQPHRFEKFTPDLGVWAILYGPVGGEAP
jgi:mannose-6-phosphate isomerase-like protein (cupin superfamily)